MTAVDGPVDPKALGRKAAAGAVTLIARSVVLQGLVFTGNLILAQILDPKDFGIFAISQFALTFFVYFGDAGLGAALVQQREKPSETTLSSVLWLQLIISAVVIAVVWVLSPLSKLVWPDFPPGSQWLLRALSLELLLTAARTVPALLMERELLFGRLSVLEVTNQLAFYAAALPLGILGFGVRALVAGVLARATVGVILAYVLRPWRPRRGIHWTLLRPIVRFGVPYQMKNLVGFATAAILPVYAGHTLGARAVGLIGWSRNLSNTPLKLVEVMGRVGFPLFSRLQSNPKALGEALGRAVHVCAAGTLLFVAVVLGLAPQIIHIAYPRWTEAMVPLYLFSGTMALGFLTPLAQSAFDAIGRPRVFLYLSMGWGSAIWILVPIATPRWGIVGFTVAFIVPVLLGNVVVAKLLGHVFPTARIVRRVRGAAFAALLEGLLARFGFARFITGPLTLVLGVVACVACFVAVLFVVDRGTFTDAWNLLRREARQREALRASAPET